jgi:hypothetical protein
MEDEQEVFLAHLQLVLNQTTAAFARTPESEHTKLLKHIIDGADVVLGVFKDSEGPKGWDHLVIKGDRKLRKIIGSRLSVPTRCAVVPQDSQLALGRRKRRGSASRTQNSPRFG